MRDAERLRADPFEEGADAYDAWYDSVAGRVVLASEVEAIRALFGSARGLSVEVGVGTGRFAEALGVGLGVDPSLEMMRIAKSRGIEVLRGVGEALPLRDSAFDIYLMVAALEFVGDAAAVIREAARVLSRAGCAIFGFIPRESAWGRMYREAGKRADSSFVGARFMIAEELDALASGAGLRRIGARSTLLDEPGAPPAGDIRDGSIAEAGFVVHAYARR